MHRSICSPHRHMILSTLLRAAMGLLLALSVLSPTSARADCAPDGLFVWPRTPAPLPLQPRLIYEGAGPEFSVLADGGRAVLVARGHRVPLTIEARHTGLGQRQIALVASASLKPSTRYVLRVYARGENRNRLKGARWAWTTVAADAKPAPLVVEGRPKVLRRVHDFGCPEAWSVEVALPARSGAETMALVTLVEVNSAAPPRTHLVRLRQGELRMGHNDCGGSFDLVGPHRQWQAMFAVVDSAGRIVEVPGAVVFNGIPRRGPTLEGPV